MTIIIQGAMDSELDVLLDHFKPKEVLSVGGYEFHSVLYKNNRLIISKTGMGVVNASVATTVGINQFHPTLVINQGCAGGHTPDIKNGDLIIGKKSVYINCFNTHPKKLGEGSNSLEWYPSHNRTFAVESTAKYVELADSVEFAGNKYVGTLGSGDMFSKEVDRINYLHGLFGELSEDMESVAALKVCESFGVDRLALRIISNNEITLEAYDVSVCKTLQKFVIAIIDKIIAQ